MSRQIEIFYTAVACIPSPTLELDCPLVEHPIPAVEPAIGPAAELLRLLLGLLLPYRVPVSQLSLAGRSSFTATFTALSADLAVISLSLVSSLLPPPVTYY